MILLNNNDFNQIYTLFEEAFIPSELRPYQLMKDYFYQNKFKIYGIKDNNQLLSAMIVWEFDDFIFIENFAVKKENRGKGLGSQMIESIQSFYQDKLIVLEVELDIDEITHKRIEFYINHKFILNQYFYIQPVLRDSYPTLKLQMMSYPYQLNDQLFNNIKSLLFKNVYNVSKDD